jgi:hypothetical protein
VSTSIRRAAIQPATYNADDRSAVAILATEDAVFSTDAATGQPLLEVWLMNGVEPVDQVPLLDNHERDSVACVVGSVSDVMVREDALVGRITISSTQEETATKVGEGHIRDVSAGIQPIEVVTIPAGRSQAVAGETYTAPEDTDLRIVTRWRLREVSVCPIGADPRAKIRSLASEVGAMEMSPKMREYLRGIGMDEAASDDEARAFYEALPEGARKRADAYVVEISEEEEESEMEAPEQPAAAPERAEGDVKEMEGKQISQKSYGGKVSKRSRGDAVQAERKRISEINRLGEGVPAELVRKAVDEGWSQEKAAMEFIDKIRSNRAAPVAPAAIHVRSSEDVTPEVLGTALAIRSQGGEAVFKARGQYRQGEGGDYVLRRFGSSKEHESKRDQLVSRAEEYAHMSLADICREACRLDGKTLSLRTSHAEVFRTAVSGSSLASIFTTNFNASFMSGYIDYEDTTTEWCNAEDVVNFLTREVATMGKFGSLTKLSRGQTALDMDISDWKESYKVTRYAGKFVVDEQDIINDRFGALEQESPRDMGLSAAQLRPGLVYSEILNNSALDVDGVNLFDASTHKNYGTTSTALAATTLQAGISAIRKQRIRDRVLNLQPRFLIVPQALYWSADILVDSPQRIIAADSGGVKNPLLGMLGVIADDRIGTAGVIDPRTGSVVAGSDTNWLLVCKPGDQGAKTIMVGYLQGTGRAPKIRSFVLDRGQWGIGWDISFDIGVKALDYRAMYFATGAGA